MLRAYELKSEVTSDVFLLFVGCGRPVSLAFHVFGEGGGPCARVCVCACMHYVTVTFRTCPVIVIAQCLHGLIGTRRSIGGGCITQTQAFGLSLIHI